jgi:hypothetical protein
MERSEAATPAATVPLPDAAGPSTAITGAVDVIAGSSGNFRECAKVAGKGLRTHRDR